MPEKLIMVRESEMGALREEFNYFASCALKGEAVKIGTAEDATAALEATLAAEESARTGELVRIG